MIINSGSLLLECLVAVLCFVPVAGGLGFLIQWCWNEWKDILSTSDEAAADTEDDMDSVIEYVFLQDSELNIGDMCYDNVNGVVGIYCGEEMREDNEYHAFYIVGNGNSIYCQRCNFKDLVKIEEA